MLPHGPLILVLAQVATSLQLASNTSKPPAPFVRVVPSMLGVLPTMIQPLFNMIIAVEAKFKIKFATAEISQMKAPGQTVGHFLALLKKKLAT